MKIFERYILKNIILAAAAVSVILVLIIMLTQSMKFLELVIESGASSLSFLILTMLAVPRFFEIVLPLSLMIGTLTIYNRLASDSELNVARSSGATPFFLARPAIILGAFFTLTLFFITAYVSPKSLAQMQIYRQVVKAQLSSFLLQDGVFNHIDDGLTIYVREKVGASDLRGILVHDARNPDEPPAFITAVRGQILAQDSGYQVVIYEGSRQQKSPKTEAIQRLDFERYVLELPDSGPIRTRWKEPDERTMMELFNPDLNNSIDRQYRHDFVIEIHRRITAPFMALALSLVAAVAMILPSHSRRGYSKQIALSVIVAIILEGLFLSAANIAKNSMVGFIMMYATVFLPIMICGLMLSPLYTHLKRRTRKPVRGLS